MCRSKSLSPARLARSTSNRPQTSAPELPACSGRRRYRSTIWCVCHARRRRSCARYCWNSKSPAGWSATAAVWCRCYKMRYVSCPTASSMIIRRLAVLAFLVALCSAPAHAQDQSFAAFEAELWPDAQAKGITRATFDLALKGVTPDQRVIAATRRQPEYGKPVGAYVNDIASRGRIANGQKKAAEWAKTFDAVEKKIGVERWVLIALWGIETDYGAEKDHWDVFRSLATLGFIRYRHPYFRNELLVAMRIM